MLTPIKLIIGREILDVYLLQNNQSNSFQFIKIESFIH